MNRCPTRDEFAAFLDGRLGEPEQAALAAHVEVCAACQRGLHELIEAAPLPLPSANEPTLASDALPPLQRLLPRLQAAAPNASGPDLGFLAPPQGPDELGRLGDYRVLKVLGAGGMGMVLLADDPSLERQVALKVMLPSLAANAGAKQRFLREARAAAKLHSDHIVTIFQVGEAQGVPYLAMELLDGMPLDVMLQKKIPLSLSQILRIGRELAKGLALAHERGLIHRDIKPANVWLDKSHTGRVKILDFGLARSQADDQHITQSGAIVGTPAYMAPEQAQGNKSVDHRADLFSLGCVLYRLVVGENPFQADTTMGVLMAIALHTPVAPVVKKPDTPRALSDLIMQLLEKDPAKRPANATEVLNRLLAIEKQGAVPPIESGESVTIPHAASVVPPVPPGPKRPRPIRKAALLVGLLLLTASAAAGWVLLHGSGGPAETATDPEKKPPSRPVAREKPFVLVRQGTEVREFPTFAALWKARQPGDEVEVFGDGPFRLPLVEVKDHSLVLRAAPGFHPVFLPDESLFENPSDVWVRLQNADLAVEGCDLLMRGVPPGHQQRALLGGVSGKCSFRRCRLLGFPGLLHDLQAGGVTLEDCLLLTGDFGLGIVPAGCELTLTNSLVRSALLIQGLTPPGGQKLRLTRNTILLTAGEPGTLVRGLDSVRDVTVTAEGNIMTFHGCLGATGSPIGAKDFSKHLRWQGRGNVYAGLAGGLDGWNAKLEEPEKDSREVPTLPFGWITDLPVRARRITSLTA